MSLVRWAALAQIGVKIRMDGVREGWWWWCMMGSSQEVHMEQRVQKLKSQRQPGTSRTDLALEKGRRDDEGVKITCCTS